MSVEWNDKLPIYKQLRALVVERIHSYPGLGTLLFNAIQARDLPVIQAVVLASSLMVLTIILGLEMIYRIIDPRIENAR